MPSQTDKTGYDGIVDGFGQFRRGIWPKKISSTEMLRARGVEEATQLVHRFRQKVQGSVGVLRE